MRMRIHIALMALCFAGLSMLGADNVRAQKVGSTSMQFLKVMPSARGTAVGEAYSVWASGAEAVFWNPGGLADVGRHEFSLTYVDWLFDARQGAFAYALSLGNFGALGLQIQYVDFGVFEETTNELPYIIDPERPGMTGRTFRPYGYLVGISYGRYLTDRFSLGLSAKYAYESLFSEKTVENVMIRQGVYDNVKTWASGILFDFGLRYNTGFRTVQIASAVQNFGPDVRYAVESYPVPLLFRVGIAAHLWGPVGLLQGGQETHRLRAAFDIFHPNDYAQQFHMGFEYEFMNILALRGGYKFNYDSDGLTLGAGLNYSIGGVHIAMDYSYGSMGAYLESVQRISLRVVVP
ncbi:hypothetical protein RmaAA213_25610 [Rhodothermus marinus]|nr:hypothetical protein RmaAA213_25610 [Rhodothermus marinus]BBM73700.1 hypothetical protein RmaAA338_25650 [Rhodothermus marinus]